MPPRSTACAPVDTLVIWKLDRLGRSVKELLTFADDLHACGLSVRILMGKLHGSHARLLTVKCRCHMEFACLVSTESP